MKNLKQAIMNHPTISSFLIMAISIALTFVPLNAIMPSTIDAQAADYLSGIIEQIAVALVLIVLIRKLGLQKQAGFQLKAEKLWLTWPIVVFSLLELSDIITGEKVIDTNRPLVIITYVLVYLSTGLFEETLCRGLMLPLLLNKWGHKKSGFYLAIFISSLLFGSFHFVHIIDGTMSPVASIAQMIYAVFMGVFFAACLIRNHSIIPIIFLHGLVDIAGDLSEISVGEKINKGYITMTIPNAITCVIIMLPFFLYGLFILRNKYEEYLAYFQNN